MRSHCSSVSRIIRHLYRIDRSRLIATHGIVFGNDRFRRLRLRPSDGYSGSADILRNYTVQLRCTVQLAPAARSSAHNLSAPLRLSAPTWTRAQPMLPRASPWCKTRGSRPPRMRAYFSCSRRYAASAISSDELPTNCTPQGSSGFITRAGERATTSLWRRRSPTRRFCSTLPKRAGVGRVVHISITNPDRKSDLPYFSAKAKNAVNAGGFRAVWLRLRARSHWALDAPRSIRQQARHLKARAGAA
jgi:hypothetical protein